MAGNGSESEHAAGDASVVRDVFDHLPGVVGGFAGPDHVFVALNAGYRAFLSPLRGPDQQLVGVPAFEVFPELMMQRVTAMFDRVYASGVAETMREWRVQPVVEETGSPTDVFLNLTVVPRRDAAGTVVGLSILGEDVTDSVRQRREIEARAAAAERRYEAARDVISELQSALLPAGLPVLPAVEVAASYLLAERDTAAGGDWFDSFVLSDGRVGLMVGDVVGHGVQASSVMGQLRAVLGERLRATGDVTAALEAVSAVATGLPGGRAATAGVAALDPLTGALEYATAGHPALLVVDGDGSRYLPPSGGAPLGTGSDYRTEHVVVGPGAMVVLYTDGILERPGRDHSASTVELAQVATDTFRGAAFRSRLSTVERVTTETVELLTRVTGHADDITLLAAQRIDPVPALDVRFPALLGQLRLAQEAIDAWMASIGAPVADSQAMRWVVGELVTNAIEHAYPAGERGDVGLRGQLGRDGVVTLQVYDRGRWRSHPRDQGRGRGLILAGSLIDSLHIDRGTDTTGTTATVTQRLSRPARLLRTGDAPVTSDTGAGRPVFLVLDQPDRPSPRVRVDGPIDAVTAPQLAVELRDATRTGTCDLVVDLSAVTVLASAGVAVLFAAADLNADHDTRLSLFAPAGSPAHQILALVNLDHHTSDPHTANVT